MVDEKQRRTFISYSRVNKDFALKLAKELKAEGFFVWLDQLDIPLGARWDVELEKALEECEIFMIIMTPASISSENVRDEIGYAIDNGKRFLPVLLESCTVPLRLRRFQYVDFTSKSFDEGVESAKSLLRNLISETTVTFTKREMISAAQEVADLDEAAQKEADEKADKDRKEKVESERLAKQKAEDDRAAQEKAEEKRLNEAEAERKEKAEAERLAKQKVEADRVAQQRSEADRKAKEDAERKAATKQEPAPLPAADGKKPGAKKAIAVGVAAVLVLVIAGVGINALSNRASAATEAPVVADTATRPVSTANLNTPTDAPTNTPVHTDTPQPTSTPTTPYIFITGIRLDGTTYIVDYEVHNFNDTLHVHMFFNTVSPEQAGSPGSGPWKLTWGKYGNPPFTQYGTANRPAAATQMCALVANANHSVQLNSGTCMDLP